MFLLVSVRHVGAHPDEHQHGVSIQISINLGKTFLRISHIRNIPLTWILARVFGHVPPFISQILDFIYWTVFTFIFIYFEWRNTENQQFAPLPPVKRDFFNWLICLRERITCQCSNLSLSLSLQSPLPLLRLPDSFPRLPGKLLFDHFWRLPFKPSLNKWTKNTVVK